MHTYAWQCSTRQPSASSVQVPSGMTSMGMGKQIACIATSPVSHDTFKTCMQCDMTRCWHTIEQIASSTCKPAMNSRIGFAKQVRKRGLRIYVHCVHLLIYVLIGLGPGVCASDFIWASDEFTGRALHTGLLKSVSAQKALHLFATKT